MNRFDVGANISRALAFLILIAVIIFACSGCTVTAEQKDGKMRLRGWGAKSAEFPDGSKISKEEPIRVPDIMPQRSDL